MKVSELRELLAGMPEYYDVLIEGQDDEMDPVVAPIRSVRPCTGYDGPYVVVSEWAQ